MTVIDENRRLLALISDTGIRLSKAAKLVRDAISLDEDMRHVNVRPHPGRRMTTKGSGRLVPLINKKINHTYKSQNKKLKTFLFAFPL